MNKTERCVGYYLDEMDANSDFRPDASALKGGSVLEALLERLDARRDDKTLYAVMRCLRDSELYVKRDSGDWLTERGHRYLKAYSRLRDDAEARCVSASELFKTVKAARSFTAWQSSRKLTDFCWDRTFWKFFCTCLRNCDRREMFFPLIYFRTSAFVRLSFMFFSGGEF